MELPHPQAEEEQSVPPLIHHVYHFDPWEKSTKTYTPGLSQLTTGVCCYFQMLPRAQSSPCVVGQHLREMTMLTLSHFFTIRRGIFYAHS